jgi:hypothetical protein
MSRQRYYIAKGWSNKHHGMLWFAFDGDETRNDVLLKYPFTSAEDALTFCDYLNSNGSTS